jgi:carbon-monoxide dehydrogenase large subunit
MDSTVTKAHTRYTGRVEDDRLVRGLGRYVSDIREDGQLAAIFLRSPHAFARISEIDADEARRVAGVVAILTAEDVDRAGVGTLSRTVPIGGVDTKLNKPDWPALARDRALYVGQPIAMIVAETQQIAEAAVELISVGYEELEPVVGIREALAPTASQIWPEAPGNIAVEWSAPFLDGTSAQRAREIIASAAHVARIELANQRIAAASLEPRGATASYDQHSGVHLLRCGCQSVWTMRSYVSDILGVPADMVRVVSDDVGGAFGMKSTAYPEYIALLVAARAIGRPIHWMSSRTESFVSDNHARDMILCGELALDEHGRFLALNVEILANMGAVLSATGPLTPTVNLSMCLPSVYDIPYLSNTVRCVFTNSVQTGAYRGAGRPEANYLIERLIDLAASQMGIDRVALRRRNLIPPTSLPYRTPLGMTYESGSFCETFETALRLGNLDGFIGRRAQSEAAGMLRGIGIACYLEQTGGALREGAALAFQLDGTLALQLGGQASGQGHATVFRDVLCDKLGLASGRVFVQQGDTNLKVLGSGTVGSRSAVMVGAAITRTAEVMLEKGRDIASLMLEAATEDIVYADGAFAAIGTDHKVSLFDVASKAAQLQREGAIEESLDTNLITETPPTFPNGCQIAEVELDPETGEVRVVNYTAVQDSGRVLNQTIATGQLQGGLAQGLGQVLCEYLPYDPSNGQLMTASFMDYGMPRADDMPLDLKTTFLEIPSGTNPLGVKGIGEGGTTGSLAALMNAIIDAIPGGIGTTLDMPATSSKIWLALQQAKQAATPKKRSPAKSAIR